MVSTTGAHGVDALGPELGVGGLAALLESSAGVSSATAGGRRGSVSVYAYLFLR